MKGGERRGEGCLQGWGEACWGCVRGVLGGKRGV